MSEEKSVALSGKSGKEKNIEIEERVFTYPEGWEEVLESLDFLPEEQRDLILKLFIETVTSPII
ncbi:MAG: hypothetical protein N3E36_04275 [Sulfolobales archaeon]|nr:hypothetical protein [Sulfolobales archaeon]